MLPPLIIRHVISLSCFVLRFQSLLRQMKCSTLHICNYPDAYKVTPAPAQLTSLMTCAVGEHVSSCRLLCRPVVNASSRGFKSCVYKPRVNETRC